MSALARVLVIAEESVQRMAFSEAVKAAGYELIDSIPSNKLNDVAHYGHIDLWLIDAFEAEKIVESMSEKGKFLLGFTPAPPPTQTRLFDRWQRKLKDKLWQALGKPEASSAADSNGAASDQTAVHAALDFKPLPEKAVKPKHLVVLGASLGGPEAVKQYLDHLSADLPVAVVLAQHTSSSAAQFLPHILTRQNMWSASVVEHGDSLSAGHISIVPPHRKLSFHESGRMYLAETSWSQPYQPNISEVFESAVEHSELNTVFIVFSGMGDDGSKAAATLKRNNATVWVQAPKSSICNSQPTAMLKTGVPEQVASPSELAALTTQRIQAGTTKGATL